MKITRLTESVSGDEVLKAIGRRSADQLQKALLGNLLAAALLVRIGDAFTISMVKRIASYPRRQISYHDSRAEFWLTVFSNLDKVLSSRRDLEDTWESWDTFPTSSKKQLLHEMEKGLDADPEVLNDGLRRYCYNFGHGTDAKTVIIRAAIRAWDRLDKNDRNKALQTAWNFLIQGDKDSRHLESLRSCMIDDIVKVPFNPFARILKILREDGEGAPAAEPAADLPPQVPAEAGTGTLAGNVAAAPFKIFKGKIIRRMKKNFYPAFFRRNKVKQLRVK